MAQTPQTTPSGSPPATTHPILDLRRQIDRVFDSFFGGFPFTLRGFEVPGFPASVPAMDVVENEDAFEVRADLPGIDEKDVELSIAEGVLTLKGEKKAEREEKKENYHLSERSYGSFSRSIRLPESADESSVTAKFDKGVLTVRVPKSKEAKERTRKIEIRSA